MPPDAQPAPTPESLGWEPAEWHLSGAQPDHPSDTVTITRMRSPFYDGERYAVRRSSFVLATDGEWEYERMPSDRDEDFYERCRFRSFAEADLAVRAAMRVLREKTEAGYAESRRRRETGRTT